MTKKEPKLRICPQVQDDISAFWEQYKKEHSVHEDINIVIYDKRMVDMDILRETTKFPIDPNKHYVLCLEDRPKKE